MAMSHRERVLTALNHKQPDRCPVQISFTPEFADRLRLDMGLDIASPHNPHGGGDGNSFELDFLLDQDMLLTSIGWGNSYNGAQDHYVDEWGIGWYSIRYNTRYGTGRYTEMKDHPLADDAALATYKAPDPHRPELYHEASHVVCQYKKEYWIVGVTCCTIFEAAWALRGLERLLADFVLSPDIAEQILDIPFNYHLEVTKRLVQCGVDMIWVGDDVGAQNAMIISPQLWRQFFKPRMAQMFSELKRINPNIVIAYHSDGNIYPIINDLIEIGLDVLNPVQPASMNPEQLKNEFGKKLSFWGSIDEQHTLPFGTPDDVRKEVQQRLSTIGHNGGLIIGPTHHVQLDTPLENFWAMMESVTGQKRPANKTRSRVLIQSKSSPTAASARKGVVVG